MIEFREESQELSTVRGGKALGGFLSGFAGSLLEGIAKGLENVDIITKTILVAIAGGTASVIGGGKFLVPTRPRWECIRE